MRTRWAALLLCAAAGLGPPAQAAQACSADKLAVLRSPPQPGDGAVLIDCHLTLKPVDVITRSLYFNHGAVSNGVQVDCAGATLSSTALNADLPRINVQSYEYQKPDGTTAWERPRDITIKNCVLEGNINVSGMGGQDSPAVRESSRTDPHHTSVLRKRAPTNIRFDTLTIDPKDRIAIYLSMGVTGVTIRNSTFLGTSPSAVVYLDAEGGSHQILNNRFKTAPAREVIAVDGSSENLIQGNEFSTSPHGGIFIYRNCGEAGTVRHNEPSKNDLLGNQFLDPRGPVDRQPHIWVASRNGNRSYCDDDAGFPYGSSVNDRDEAHRTAIKGNYFNARSQAILLGDGPNYLIDNVAEDAGAIPGADAFGSTFVGNRAGHGPVPSTSCFWRDRIPMLLRDGESLELDATNPKQVTCAKHRLVCHGGTLDQRPRTCDGQHITQRHFRCSVKDSNEGCEKVLSCGSHKRLQALKARCNLEFGPIDPDALAGAPWNSLAVERASDVVADGHCAVGAYDISSSNTQLLGFLSTPATARCQEHDADGGECQIEGEYVCY
ncbi:hypothetical protein [Ideonella sp.]|uniref:hypothetical protein n=1 Tax=Ideonella sp. TaxID=1929293 RepID=UPI0035B1B159